jgi:hypothetical protein
VTFATVRDGEGAEPAAPVLEARPAMLAETIKALQALGYHEHRRCRG